MTIELRVCKQSAAEKYTFFPARSANAHRTAICVGLRPSWVETFFCHLPEGLVPVILKETEKQRRCRQSTRNTTKRNALRNNNLPQAALCYVNSRLATISSALRHTFVHSRRNVSLEANEIQATVNRESKSQVMWPTIRREFRFCGTVSRQGQNCGCCTGGQRNFN